MSQPTEHPLDDAARARGAQVPVQSVDVLIVGAGQAGLGAAFWLQRITGLDVQVIEQNTIGGSWLARWDSLRLFTPRRFSGLPGMRFPPGARFPDKRDVAEYLRGYAERFALPVEAGHQVSHLWQSGELFHARTDRAEFRARHVVVAAGPFSRPYLPPAADALDAEVFQLHSAAYGRPGDIPGDDVIVVGGGNSAAQLSVELAPTHQVTVISPRKPWYLPTTLLGVDLYWWLYLTRTLNAGASTSVSRYVRGRGDSIIGTELRREVQSGRIRLITGRVIGASGKDLTLADSSHVRAHNVLWCTGYRPGLDWIDLPGALDERGEPVHVRGASPVAGLHWMGLPWQSRLNSSIIDGVNRDAHATAKRIRALACMD
ncbi:putative flavoprotein involved in K+ transport [Nakamurella sp. UYEF19]|uniref:flavin-containing monooxygenase n=1 Tax=Nakamurella sp. UYEF19 TaxID=1756392 RepID=UPI00339A6DE3